MNEQQFMGTAVAVLCGVGWYFQGWLLERTGKGRWLVGRLGPSVSRWVLGGLFAAGFLFGGLLAANVIRPLRW